MTFKWTDVTTELPLDAEAYLVSVTCIWGQGSSHHSIARYIKSEECWVDACYSDDWLEGVTHWTRLPKAPEITNKPIKKEAGFDPHIACYAYPCCDENPLGCTVIYGCDAEPYGHRG